VAGKVSTQRRATAATTMPAATIASVRNTTVFLIKSAFPAHSRASGKPAIFADKLVSIWRGMSGSRLRWREGALLRASAFLDAIFFVAAGAIILADVAESRLEGIEVRHAVEGRLGVGAELDQPRLEVFDVLPDFRLGRGVAAGLGIVRKQGRRLRRRIFERTEHLARLGEIKGRLALGHGGAGLGLVAVRLHQCPARGNRILLRQRNADAKRDRSHGKKCTNHVMVSLSILPARTGGCIQANAGAGKETNRALRHALGPSRRGHRL